MPTDPIVQVEYLSISSACRRNGHVVEEIARGSCDVQHIIKVYNGSTIQHDVRIETQLPDTPPRVAFVHQGHPKAPQWATTLVAVEERSDADDYADVHCIAPTGNVRIHSPVIEYRWGPKGKWVTDPKATTHLAIQVRIT